jgi:hypothetical protein
MDPRSATEHCIAFSTKIMTNVSLSHLVRLAFATNALLIHSPALPRLCDNIITSVMSLVGTWSKILCWRGMTKIGAAIQISDITNLIENMS